MSAGCILELPLVSKAVMSKEFEWPISEHVVHRHKPRVSGKTGVDNGSTLE